MASILRPPFVRVFATLVVAVACLPASGRAQPADPDATRMIDALGLREAAELLSATPGWRPPRRVLVRELGPEQMAALQRVAPGVELVGADSVDEAVGLAPSVDAVLGFCEEPVLAAGARVKWVQTYNAGVERCLASPVIRERGILLTNMQRIAGPVMAEHAMALVLAHARGLPGYLAAQRDGRWSRGGQFMTSGPERAYALTGKTMLVVGFGGVGSEVAKRAQAFGMTVLAIRNSRAAAPPSVSRMGLPSDLPAWVREADVVVNTLPLTPDTQGMFDARIFGAMKPTAFFVNVGRGATVVTDDLLQALQTGRIAGAGLDVVDPEPLPPDHPLWKAPGLILTPHVSANSDIDDDARSLLIRENLRRYVAGGRMLSVVDPARGY